MGHSAKISTKNPKEEAVFMVMCYTPHQRGSLELQYAVKISFLFAIERKSWSRGWSWVTKCHFDFKKKSITLKYWKAHIS